MAAVTASSDRPPAQAAQKATDGIIKGYPDEPSAEWVTDGERAGAWMELRWGTAHPIDRVRLHDRPNPDDQILSATLTFSDGTSVPVEALPNDGAGLDVVFPARRVEWLRLTVTKTSATTANTGLAEILVFERPN